MYQLIFYQRLFINISEWCTKTIATNDQTTLYILEVLLLIHVAMFPHMSYLK